MTTGVRRTLLGGVSALSRRLPQSRTKTRIGRVVGAVLSKTGADPLVTVRTDRGVFVVDARSRTECEMLWSRRVRRRTTSTSCVAATPADGVFLDVGANVGLIFIPVWRERDRGTCGRCRTGPGQLREVGGRVPRERTDGTRAHVAEHRPRRGAGSAEAGQGGFGQHVRQRGGRTRGRARPSSRAPVEIARRPRATALGPSSGSTPVKIERARRFVVLERVRRRSANARSLPADRLRRRSTTS